MARRCFSRDRNWVWQTSRLSFKYCSDVSSCMASSNCSSPGSEPQLHSWTMCWKWSLGFEPSSSLFSSWPLLISPSFTISFHNFPSPSSVKAVYRGSGVCIYHTEEATLLKVYLPECHILSTCSRNVEKTLTFLELVTTSCTTKFLEYNCVSRETCILSNFKKSGSAIDSISFVRIYYLWFHVMRCFIFIGICKGVLNRFWPA